MSSDTGVPTAQGRTRLPLVFEEAGRQLGICNACRYCEGMCAVFPALERRTVLGRGDISQIANVCHDCRACFDACMYSTPHEFGLNIPRALSAVRAEDYRRYVWPHRVPRLLRGWPGVFSGAFVACVVVILLAAAHTGWRGLVTDGSGASSPYDLIAYGPLLALILLPALYSVLVMLGAARAYWREVGGAPDGLKGGAVARAVWYAATLRYLRGGGEDCYYPEDEKPSAGRRRLHALVMYGFGLCIVSTSAAAVMQDFLGVEPPYDVLSVPVATGFVGGVGLVVGSAGLLMLKARSSAVTSFAQMTVKDYGLLVALTFLALSGLLTLFVRATPAYGLVYLVHLASVALSFAAAPYSKFVHLVYRFLALVRDNLESGRT
ncbi:tricarballylate utilization 4Fe-4S protein TcuB [Streptomyces sp. NPDC050560]|uniref:tricarballylate utilization 4Fe-4S protein TcuB n=1 Tax=Streptomyces sp. NPDC050560 TaxID=3365630 RepID=UPI0037904454